MGKNENDERTQAIWFGIIVFLVSIIYFLFNWDILNDIENLILDKKNNDLWFSESVCMVILFIMSLIIILQNISYFKKKGWRKFIISSIYLFISYLFIVLLIWLIWHFWIGKSV